MSKKNRERIRKDFITAMWMLTIGGFIIGTAGLIRFLYGKPIIGITLKTFQPFIENGLTIAIVCYTLFFCGLYNLINQKRLIEKDVLLKEQEEKEFIYKKRKSSGYKVKRKRKKNQQKNKANLVS